MTRVRALLLPGLAVALLRCVGSDPESTTTPQQGAQGEACFDNGTCLGGLACIAARCVLPTDASGGGGGDGGGGDGGDDDDNPDAGGDGPKDADAPSDAADGDVTTTPFDSGHPLLCPADQTTKHDFTEPFGDESLVPPTPWDTEVSAGQGGGPGLSGVHVLSAPNSLAATLLPTSSGYSRRVRKIMNTSGKFRLTTAMYLEELPPVQETLLEVSFDNLDKFGFTLDLMPSGALSVAFKDAGAAPTVAGATANVGAFFTISVDVDLCKGSFHASYKETMGGAQNAIASSATFFPELQQPLAMAKIHLGLARSSSPASEGDGPNVWYDDVSFLDPAP